MSIAFGFHPVAVIAAILVAGVLTWWTYRQTTPPVSTARRRTLIGLRWMSLTVILLLLAEPIVRTVTRSLRTPTIAVLVDASRSLSTEVHPDADYRASIAEALRSIDDAAGAYETDVYRFGSETSSWSPGDDSLAFDEGRTDIASAFDEIRGRYLGKPLRALVLVSDGRYNTGRNPIYPAEHFPVPIHTVVVGDTATYRDLRVERVATNEVAYVDREMPVLVTLHATGFQGQTARVSISGSGIRSIDTTVVVPSTESEMQLDMTLKPTSEGFKRFEAIVEPLEGERTVSNNRMSFSARVLKRRLNLLFLAAGPSPDVAALRELLDTDPDLHVEAHTQKSETEWYENNRPPASLDRFDAIVLAGYPGRQAPVATLDALAATNKPLLFLLDRTTDLRLVREKLSAVLPVSVETVRSGFVDASAVASEAGRTHPILQVSGALNRMPPLSYSSSRWSASPDARTLATVNVRGITLDDPLLVVRSRSGTRSAAILGAGIWRWRNVPSDLSDQDALFPQLVSNLLQWITTKNDDRPVRVRPTEELFDGGDRVQFVGEVYDESLEPITDASVGLSVTDSTGITIEYRMESLGSGRYAGNVGRLPEGSYRYRAVAVHDGVEVGADSGQFAVGELLVEFHDVRADPDLMRSIAQRSGGRSAMVDNLTPIREALRQDETGSEEVEEESQLPLRRYFPLLLLTIGLLSAEWVIRKRSGMV